MLFLLLAASRWFGLEEDLRVFLRGGLRADGLYQERREFQAVIASAALVISTLLGMTGMGMMLRSGVLQKPGPSRIVALAGSICGGLVLLVALRLVSFHAIDVLLFRGPRLNWFLDIGGTLAVAGAAAWYVAMSGKAPPPRR
jgi:fumarate reductase subunit D